MAREQMRPGFWQAPAMDRLVTTPSHLDVLCIGGINIDQKLRALAPMRMDSSNPCTAMHSAGGVARNLAENLARLGLKVALAGHLGRDAAAQSLLASLHALGVDTQHCLESPTGSTGSYTAVLDEHGQLVVGMADMALTEQLSPERLEPLLHTHALLWLVDMNLPQASLAWLTEQARARGQRLVMLAVSDPKMSRLPQDLRGLDTLVLNRGELAALAAHRHWPARKADDIARSFDVLRSAGLKRLVVTQGEQGVRFIEAGETSSQCLSPQTPRNQPVRDVSGAGDAFCAGLSASYLRYPRDALQLHVQRAMRLAELTVLCEHSVSPAITPDLI